MRLTAFEQSVLPIRGRADQSTGCIDSSLGRSIVDLGDRLGARVASWHGRDAIRLHQFVGVFRIGDVVLEILPKIDGLPEPADVRRNLLAMLAETQDLDLRASELVGHLENTEPFIAALCRLYCRRLLEAVRQGLRQEYVLHEEQLACLRGKVDWAKHVKLQTTQRLDFPCIFDERSEDTPLNRALKAALVASSWILEDAASSSVITELRHAMSAVADLVPAPETIARLRTDRMNRHLEPLLRLAKLILGLRNPNQLRARNTIDSTFALAWDMNVLFEEYVGRVTVRVLRSSGQHVLLQSAARHLALEGEKKRASFLLKPDILVQIGRNLTALADTKWKRLDPKSPDLGVSEADVYQLLAYALRYRVSQAFLIFPHHPALGTAGIKRLYHLPEDIRLAVMTVDVSRIETVGSQLLHSIGSGTAGPPAILASLS